ncbi:MAG: ATPase [Muricauda sp.]|nr:ATP-binding protein [Allomuricauda sp.]MAU27273.1 ATPase [Allomuricauda sp.]MBC30888.1 ATPase [Allomuricauda sp.]
MEQKRIVVTGAPGTGKTSVINSLEANGYRCFHEVIRSMTAKAKNKGSKKPVSNPLVFVEDPLQFNKNLLSGRVQHYMESKNASDTILFFDRGIPDVLAYMDFFNQPYPAEFEEACRKNQYDSVLILPPWKEIYVSDNERLESYDEAEKLHEQLLDTYQRFGYEPILVPKTSVQERLHFIIEAFNLQ